MVLASSKLKQSKLTLLILVWYFTWIPGVGAALAFGIINVMWLEASYAFGELDEHATLKEFPVERERPTDTD